MEKGSAKMEETMSNDSEIKLVFRCHTCRKCVATKAELKSHLTDHPPLVDLKKQVIISFKLVMLRELINSFYINLFLQ